MHTELSQVVGGDRVEDAEVSMAAEYTVEETADQTDQMVFQEMALTEIIVVVELASILRPERGVRRQERCMLAEAEAQEWIVTVAAEEEQAEEEQADMVG